MINWKEDLPMPTDQWDCVQLSEEVQEILDILNMPHDEFYENHDHQVTAQELLECFTPTSLETGDHSQELKRDVAMWLFKNEAIDIHTRFDDDHHYRQDLKDTCGKYLKKLTKDYIDKEYF